MPFVSMEENRTSPRKNLTNKKTKSFSIAGIPEKQKSKILFFIACKHHSSHFELAFELEGPMSFSMSKFHRIGLN